MILTERTGVMPKCWETSQTFALIMRGIEFYWANKSIRGEGSVVGEQRREEREGRAAGERRSTVRHGRGTGDGAGRARYVASSQPAAPKGKPVVVKRSDQPAPPKGSPVKLCRDAPALRSKHESVADLFSTTKRKWIGALVALVLVVGIGNAIGGTSSPSEPAGQSLAVAGLSSQASSSKSAEAEAARAAEVKAKEEADRKAKEEAEAQAAAEAEAQARAQREAEAQAQRDAEAQRAAAARSAPAASPQSRAAEPQSTPAPQASAQNGATVYIAASGKGGSYHKRSTCGRMKDSSPLSLSDAQAQGYAPCGNCY